MDPRKRTRVELTEEQVKKKIKTECLAFLDPELEYKIEHLLEHDEAIRNRMIYFHHLLHKKESDDVEREVIFH